MNDSNNKPIYESIPEFSKSEMEQAIIEDDIEKLIFVPLFASLHYEDGDFAKEICIKLASHSNIYVRGSALESFEHIARIDGKLDKNIVKPLVEKALLDENKFVRMKANDTRDGLKHFLNWKFNK